MPLVSTTIEVAKNESQIFKTAPKEKADLYRWDCLIECSRAGKKELLMNRVLLSLKPNAVSCPL
jgi:hypothetical protein